MFTVYILFSLSPDVNVTTNNPSRCIKAPASFKDSSYAWAKNEHLLDVLLQFVYTWAIYKKILTLFFVGKGSRDEKSWVKFDR